jgi:GTPase SAR1 and related small G proteins
MMSQGSIYISHDNLSRRETFNHLTRWLDEARQNGNPQMSFILVGNKCDMESE